MRNHELADWENVSKEYGFGPEKLFGSVPHPGKNPTRCFLVVQTPLTTSQPAGFAGCG